jgi:hypothetical protein
VTTLIDTDSYQPSAVTMSRQCIELAGTTIGAVAVGELTSFNQPPNVGHRASGTNAPATQTSAHFTH